MTAAAAPPWWRRPVRLRDLLAVLLLTALLWLLGSVLLLRALHERLADPSADAWQARVVLRELPIRFTLAAGLLADARTPHRISADLHLHPRLAVPIDQPVQVGLGDAPLPARARLDTVVAVDTRFRFQQLIPVVTELDAQVRLVSWLPPVAVKVPVRLQVPVDVEVPVRARVPVQVDAPVQAGVNAPLQVPLRTTLALRPDVRARLDVDLIGRTGFRLLGPMAELPAVVEQAEVHIGRGDLRIGLLPAPGAAPSR